MKSQIIEVPFNRLAIGTTFTFSRFAAFIYEKISSTQARMVNCSDPSECYTDLDDADIVRPVWIPETK